MSWIGFITEAKRNNDCATRHSLAFGVSSEAVALQPRRTGDGCRRRLLAMENPIKAVTLDGRESCDSKREIIDLAGECIPGRDNREAVFTASGWWGM